MILAVCVDDGYGLQFGGRRQSRDREMIRDLMACAGELWIHPASAGLFPEEATIHVCEDFLSQARNGQWCFAEDRGYLKYSDRIERIILYRWNRDYPRDQIFDFPGQWRLAQSRDFTGSSHEKITREEYTK